MQGKSVLARRPLLSTVPIYFEVEARITAASGGNPQRSHSSAIKKQNAGQEAQEELRIKAMHMENTGCLLYRSGK